MSQPKAIYMAFCHYCNQVKTYKSYPGKLIPCSDCKDKEEVKKEVEKRREKYFEKLEPEKM